MPKITLSCCVCGKKKHGEVAQLPQLGVEFADIVKAAEWIAVMELRRTLAFCSVRCEEAALKKDRKSYRKHIPTLPKEAEGETE